MRHRALLFACLLLCQCASLRQLSADPSDFARYREFRTAEQLPLRFRAASEYLQQPAQGRWHGEVRQWFDRASGEYLSRFWNDEHRLLAYQGWTGAGPYSVTVEHRLSLLAAQSVAARERERQLLRAARQTETDLARAAALRQTLLAELKTWLSELARVRSFGRPTSELPHEFLHRLRELDPPAVCSADRCSKVVLLPYGVAAERKQSWRELLLQVEVQLDQGLLTQVSLEGVGLLPSIAEALQKRAVARTDLQAKAEALGAAMQLVAMVLEQPLPVARCEQPAVSPMVLVRQCEGVRLEVHVAQSDDAPDRIVIKPAASGS